MDQVGLVRASKLAVMLWGLELDRRLRAAGSPIVTQLTHPGWVASNLSHLSDSPLMSLSHKAVKVVADRLANDIDEGAAPSLVLHPANRYPRAASSEWAAGVKALRGGPVLIGRTQKIACDLRTRPPAWWRFAEEEDSTARR